MYDKTDFTNDYQDQVEREELDEQIRADEQDHDFDRKKKLTNKELNELGLDKSMDINGKTIYIKQVDHNDEDLNFGDFDPLDEGGYDEL